MIRHSATLALNEAVRDRQANGENVLHLGFGEAGLPVLPGVGKVLAESAHRNDYGPVAGSAGARRAAAGYLTRRGLETEPDQVVFGPGSKSLLFAVLTVIPGAVVLPRPSWVSYGAQAALAGRQVIWVDVPSDAGGIPDPEILERALAAAKRQGLQPGALILTVPDNPTGTIASPERVKQVCDVASRHELVVVSDEIYRDLSHGDPVHSPALELPGRTIVTGGLSKSTALGGYRIGFARLPRGLLFAELRAGIVGVASEVWSSLPGPMQAVAEYVLDDPEEVRTYVDAARRLHGLVVNAVYEEVTAVGARCRAPQGGFYLYPDLEPMRLRLVAQGVHTGEQLAQSLLTRYGVGVLAGAEFGDDPAALRFRVATSLLCGTNTRQRWAALAAEEPLVLPWIDASLAHLRDALQQLLS